MTTPGSKILKKTISFLTIAFIIVFCCSMLIIRKWSENFILCDYDENIEDCIVTEYLKNGGSTYVWCEEMKYLIPLATDDKNASLGYFIQSKDNLSKNKKSDSIIVNRQGKIYKFILSH